MIVLLCGGYLSEENYWRTYARLDLAVEMAQRSDSTLLISSGVAGANLYGSGFCVPESHEYAKYAVEIMNFPSDRVFVEDLSRDTVGNVFFSNIFIRSLGLNQSSMVTWITNAFHEKRLLVILEKAARQTDCWVNRVLVVPDIENTKEIEYLKESEQQSLNRFKKDLYLSPEWDYVSNLISKHDFYRAKSFLDARL